MAEGCLLAVHHHHEAAVCAAANARAAIAAARGTACTGMDSWRSRCTEMGDRHDLQAHNNPAVPYIALWRAATPTTPVPHRAASRPHMLLHRASRPPSCAPEPWMRLD